MPTIKVGRLGNIEYHEADLPERVKAETLTGIRTAPIYVTEALGPGAKKEYIVAHEVGHRLKYRIAEEIARDDPKLFFNTSINQGILQYLTAQGLSEENFSPIHPEVKDHIGFILKAAREGHPVPDVLAGEAIAEIFANYATDKGNFPSHISDILSKALTEKPELSIHAAPDISHYEEGPHDFSPGPIIALAIVAVIFIASVRDLPGAI